MTIETTPYVYVPSGTFEEQRFSRLCDSISEYMDGDASAAAFLSDLRKGLVEGRDYYLKQVQAHDEVIEAIDNQWAEGCL